MPNIAFITGGELETNSRRMWTGNSLGVAPVSGVAGAHGKVYDTPFGSVSIGFSPSSLVTVRGRWYFRVDSDNQPFMVLWDEDIGQTQVMLIYRSTGAIEVVRQSTVLATSAAGLFVPETWYELEFRAKISNGAGSVAVNRNGSLIICLPSGVDTQSTSNPYVNTWTLGNNEIDSYWDDCVLDRSGAYLGTGEVETLMPSGPGDVTQLSPDTIGPNYTRVNEKPHDSDTSYVFSTGDQIDTYQFEDRSIAGTPLGVMQSVQARHTVGAPSVKLVCRIDGDNYESSQTFATGSSYGNHFNHAWPVNPATGAVWTDESINAAQWGVRCLVTGIRVTQVGLQVYVKTGESEQCRAAGVSRDYCRSVDPDVN